MTTEIRCEPLGEEQLQIELKFFADLFVENAKSTVVAQYGWACDLGTDDMYTDIDIVASELVSFVKRSQYKGVFILGKSDLLFRSSDGEIEFMLCHESDVHFSGPGKLMDLVRNRWETMAVSPYLVDYGETSGDA